MLSKYLHSTPLDFTPSITLPSFQVPYKEKIVAVAKVSKIIDYGKSSSSSQMFKAPLLGLLLIKCGGSFNFEKEPSSTVSPEPMLTCIVEFRPSMTINMGSDEGKKENASVIRCDIKNTEVDLLEAAVYFTNTLTSDNNIKSGSSSSSSSSSSSVKNTSRITFLATDFDEIIPIQQWKNFWLSANSLKHQIDLIYTLFRSNDSLMFGKIPLLCREDYEFLLAERGPRQKDNFRADYSRMCCVTCHRDARTHNLVLFNHPYVPNFANVFSMSHSDPAKRSPDPAKNVEIDANISEERSTRSRGIVPIEPPPPPPKDESTYLKVYICKACLDIYSKIRKIKYESGSLHTAKSLNESICALCSSHSSYGLNCKSCSRSFCVKCMETLFPQMASKIMSTMSDNNTWVCGCCCLGLSKVIDYSSIERKSLSSQSVSRNKKRALQINGESSLNTSHNTDINPLHSIKVDLSGSKLLFGSVELPRLGFETSDNDESLESEVDDMEVSKMQVVDTEKAKPPTQSKKQTQKPSMKTVTPTTNVRSSQRKSTLISSTATASLQLQDLRRKKGLREDNSQEKNDNSKDKKAHESRDTVYNYAKFYKDIYTRTVIDLSCFVCKDTGSSLLRCQYTYSENNEFVCGKSFHPECLAIMGI